MNGTFFQFSVVFESCKCKNTKYVNDSSPTLSSYIINSHFCVLQVHVSQYQAQMVFKRCESEEKLSNWPSKPYLVLKVTFRSRFSVFFNQNLAQKTRFLKIVISNDSSQSVTFEAKMDFSKNGWRVFFNKLGWVWKFWEKLNV